MHALALSSNPYPIVDADALAALRVPTLLLRGERTMPVHRATFAALTELMPRTHTVPGCGHGVHRDNL
ncbi:alpha/beta hydrolase [Variovorax sp. LjRoot290]|uniref:alpha/beta fold hydrolase n=1 Tax=unclassified Variovorax TaxID=663243 RepID=UPI003ED0EB57